jgi:hypothetical protein
MVAADMHPDDEFHTPRTDDPFWAETAWFAFSVPELRLSGQFYPFFSRNQDVCSAAVYLWDDRGAYLHDALYAKNIWHLPIPEGSLGDLVLGNGLRYTCLEPRSRYAVGYVDPDSGEVSMELTFEALTEPHWLGRGHFDQPCRVRGEVVVQGRQIDVDSYGFRDRSWGRRPQFGGAMVRGASEYGGYSYGTVSANDGFHATTQDFGAGAALVHGHLVRDGRWAKLASASRVVEDRDPVTGFPSRVRITGRDEYDRAFDLMGETINQFGFPLNPNMFSINCLTRWEFEDGTVGYGEDHENFTSAAARRFFRSLT